MSHRRIHKAARENLIKAMGRRGPKPLYVCAPREAPVHGLYPSMLEHLLRELDTRSCILTADGVRVEYLKPFWMPKVIAGKRGRKRGLRHRLPPLRIVTFVEDPS